MNPYEPPPANTAVAARRARLGFLWALLASVLIAVVVRMHGLTATAIWCDEASSVITSRYPLALVWFHAAHDVHPPFYYLLLHLWMGVFGEGIFSIRLLSAIPGIGTVVVGALLVRQLSTPRAALLAALLLALFPFAVRYSQEVRMYSLLTLLLLSATLMLMRWLRRPERHRYLVIYSLLMTASFYTHYFTIFCVLVHWLHVGLRSLRQGEQFKPLWRPSWWLANLATALMFMPWVPKLYDQINHMKQLEAGNDVGWIPPVSTSSLPSAMWQFWTLDDGMLQSGLVFFGLPVIVLLLAWVVVRNDHSRERFPRFLVLYTFVPMLAVFVVSLFSSVLVERYLMFAAIGLPMLVALAIEQLCSRSKLLAGGILAATLVIDGIGLAEVYRVDEPQFDSLVNYVNEHYQPGDTVVISDLFWYFTYVYYNHTPLVPKLYTPSVAQGGYGRPNAYGFGTLVEQQGKRIYVNELAPLPAANHRVWLVGGADRPGQPDDFKGIPAQWHLIDAQKAQDTEVRLYEVKAG
jgi:uncharacterized membrane protein